MNNTRKLKFHDSFVTELINAANYYETKDSISLKEIARATDISLDSVYQIFSGHRRPTQPQLHKLAHFFRDYPNTNFHKLYEETYGPIKKSMASRESALLCRPEVQTLFSRLESKHYTFTSLAKSIKPIA